VFISVTRLRIRSIRFLPAFALDPLWTRRQLRKATGLRDVALLADRAWVFWTVTAWDSAAAMRSYMSIGAHKAAMPALLHWCDEASVIHWEQPEATLIRAGGRASKVRNPAPHHADLSFAAPRTTGAVPIRPD
jgi:hypothetical protein